MRNLWLVSSSFRTPETCLDCLSRRSRWKRRLQSPKGIQRTDVHWQLRIDVWRQRTRRHPATIPTTSSRAQACPSLTGQTPLSRIVDRKKQCRETQVPSLLAKRIKGPTNTKRGLSQNAEIADDRAGEGTTRSSYKFFVFLFLGR